MQLIPDWKTALAQHWSSWVYYAIGLLALIPEALSFFGQSVDIPPYVYLGLVVVGLGAKVVKQELPPKEAPDAGQ